MSHVNDTQDEVFALLSDPATHGGGQVTRVDTHAAVVFLAPERVLKVKRAVKFPFLDFSTLEKRKAACEAELDINRAYAPDIYRRVVPITRVANERLALDGDGEPVEWAVEMRRFDETQTLDQLADQGLIDAKLGDALGRIIAQAHAKAAPVDPAPWIAALGAYIDEHVGAFGETPNVFPPAEVAALAQASRAAYDRVRPLLIDRGARGLIRRIHGDLHLGNIVLIDGCPVLFDAIEFSPLIASGDVLYDLAFLLMDLTERGLGHVANAVLNRYFAQTQRAEDFDALAALPLYLSMRAQIRANVTAARLGQVEESKRADIAATAKKYFDWARRLITPAAPVLVAVGGFSGTGKSVLARALAPNLAPAPGAVVLRSDVERKALFGKAEAEPLPPEAYSEPVTARVYATITDKARRAAAAGHSVIIDAVFARQGERVAVERSGTVIGVRFRGLFLEADVATRVARVESRDRDASDADASVARTQEGYDLGALDWLRIDATGAPEATLKRATDALA
jgi:aminoglycoside phosphotransferase family enzyme/predicted kinase